MLGEHPRLVMARRAGLVLWDMSASSPPILSPTCDSAGRNKRRSYTIAALKESAPAGGLFLLGFTHHVEEMTLGTES